ncbi:Rv1157c family protein [Tomitella biformata]|uniref:Rv1157c family protein n=1 Tax=Tomitella biformata TaxID=630403 RepID=UPI0004AD706C|nr:hypothetical protein [Tomitella biformata]
MMALALASAAAIILPATAAADESPAPVPAVSEDFLAGILNGDAQLPSNEELAAMQSFLPAIIGAIASQAQVPAAGTNNDLLAQAKQMLQDSSLSEEMKGTLDRVITFLDGSGGGGPDIPESGAVPIQQFLYPTIGKGCIGGDQDSVGMALMVSGPTEAPAPGVPGGQAGYVFTALGTNPAQPNPAEQLMVSWINLDTGAQGTQAMTNEAGMNAAEGPTTLSTIANTGSGRIVSTMYGSIVSQGDDGAAPISCTILPTVGLGVVH